ncbi:fibronectin-like isoform X2 [Apostichopus japonicus]|uniref:fibronectin-like isoform X2 n=1 Tax=Stichopus japonicus TaxID=307972 RepID=UPI003AB76849
MTNCICSLSVLAVVLVAAIVPVLGRKASAPENFQLVDVTTNSITLSWNDPPLVGAEKLKGYRLNYREASDRKEKKLTLRKTQTTYTVADLAEGTAYIFSVFAKTQDGVGRGSDELEVSTLSTAVEEPTVPGVPQFFDALPGIDSIFARWVQPEGDDFTGYILGIGRDSPDETTVELGPSVNTHTFRDLEPGTNYVLAIRAVNAVGPSQVALLNSYIEQQRPNPPESFTTVPSVYSIEASWAPAGDDIRSFIVGIGINDLEEDTLEINWDENYYVFEDLTPGTLYLVSVRAVNENGPGEAAIDKVTTEELLTPSPPVIDSVESTEDSITVRWTAPTEEVTGYEITLDPLGTETAGGDVTSFTFSDLAADTEYVLRIKAVNEVGSSTPSEQSVATDPLGPPQSPTITDLQATSDSIFVEWQSVDPNVIRFEITLVGIDRQALGVLENSHTFTNLDPNTEYTIEVRSLSPGGSSEAATSRIYTEPLNIPPAPIIESDSSTTDSITVNWRRASEDVFSYEISIDGSSPIPLGPEETSYTFTNLEPSTEYFIALAVTNLGGVSPPATERLSTEAPSPLPKPIIRSAEATTDTIAIMWEQPIEPIQSYELTLVGNDPVTLGKQETSYTFFNLQPDTRYTVELRVFNEGGPSSPARSRITTDALPPTEAPIIDVSANEYRVRNFEAEIHGQTVILRWEPPIDEEDETLLGYLLKIDADAISLSTSLRLHYRQNSYTFRNLEPLVEFHAILEPIRRELPTAPSAVTFTTYVSRFVPPRVLSVEILTSSSARIVWMDPTVSPVTGVTDSRYYSLRYRPVQGSSNYLFANTREFEHSVGDLIPDTEYEFSVQTIVEGVTSGYSVAVRNTTLSETDGQAPRLLTVVQLMLDFPNYIHATLNWLPPLERTEEVSGYNVQFSTVAEPSELDWQNLPVEGAVMAATVPKLTTNITASFRIQAFFFAGVSLGPFSPVISFITPVSAQGGVEEGNCVSETDSVTQRITETRERGGGVPPLGVPLPFCDEYLSQYACPWPTLVCTCIPRGTSAVAAVPNAKPNPGCGAVSEAAPCTKVYNRVMDALKEARHAGFMLMGATIPYCREDGYFNSKQCGGSICYCVDELGMPNGLEAPLWEAATLNCR